MTIYDLLNNICTFQLLQNCKRKNLKQINEKKIYLMKRNHIPCFQHIRLLF